MQFNIIQNVSEMVGQTSEVSSPHQNKEKVHINISPQTPGFLGTAAMFAQPQTFRFLCGAL